MPPELIRMKARGRRVSLSDNAGFTLPDNIGELGDDITELDLSNRSLNGEDDDQIVSSQRIFSTCNGLT